MDGCNEKLEIFMKMKLGDIEDSEKSQRYVSDEDVGQAVSKSRLSA